MTVRRAVLTWLMMIPIAFANGTLRQFVYGPWLSEAAARQISCFTAIAAFAALIFTLTRRWRFTSTKHALVVGATWALATVGFETALGRSSGLPWSTIFADYDIVHGQLWGLVVLFIASAPLLTMLRDRARADGADSGATP